MTGSPDLLVLICIGVPIGLFFGVVPGLGGKVGIALLIPLVFGMDALPGAVFLIAMHSVVHTGGSIPSILLGIPGSGPDAATIMDGYPMAKKGMGGIAIGASLTASGLGGIFGAIFLAFLVPLVRPLVLNFGPAEIFLLCLFGLTFIASLSGKHLLRGLIMGCLGLLLANVGLNPHTGDERFTFGQLALWDGVNLIVVVLALFAVPEMLALAGNRASTGKAPPKHRAPVKQTLMGMWLALKYRWLLLRSSLMGAFLGVLPGVGGEAASWICYGLAAQTSKRPMRFGKGAVEGVIAPEAANNAKEGGALLPTLLFGIPGSGGMALMLGAFFVLGINPGPGIFADDGKLVWSLIWALCFANILGVVLCLVLSRPFLWLSNLSTNILIPIVLFFVVFGLALTSNSPTEIFLLVLFSGFGVAFKALHWPRPPLALGLVLGGIVENSATQSLTLWGPAFIFEPSSLVLMIVLSAPLAYLVFRRSKHGLPQIANQNMPGSDIAKIRMNLVLSIVLFFVFGLALFMSFELKQQARLMPLSVSVLGLILLVCNLPWNGQSLTKTQPIAFSLVGQGLLLRYKGFCVTVGWFICLLVLTLNVNLLLIGPPMVFLYVFVAHRQMHSALVAGSFVCGIILLIRQAGLLV